MKLCETLIPGCYEITPHIFKDHRGVVVKTFHDELFVTQGLITTFVEEFYSLSHQGFMRGLHFQLPPKDLVKLVDSFSGAVFCFE